MTTNNTKDDSAEFVCVPLASGIAQPLPVLLVRLPRVPAPELRDSAWKIGQLITNNATRALPSQTGQAPPSHHDLDGTPEEEQEDPVPRCTWAIRPPYVCLLEFDTSEAATKLKLPEAFNQTDEDGHARDYHYQYFLKDVIMNFSASVYQPDKGAYLLTTYDRYSERHRRQLQADLFQATSQGAALFFYFLYKHEDREMVLHYHPMTLHTFSIFVESVMGENRVVVPYWGNPRSLSMLRWKEDDRLEPRTSTERTSRATREYDAQRPNLIGLRAVLHHTGAVIVMDCGGASIQWQITAELLVGKAEPENPLCSHKMEPVLDRNEGGLSATAHAILCHDYALQWSIRRHFDPFARGTKEQNFDLLLFKLASKRFRRGSVPDFGRADSLCFFNNNRAKRVCFAVAVLRVILERGRDWWRESLGQPDGITTRTAEGEAWAGGAQERCEEVVSNILYHDLAYAEEVTDSLTTWERHNIREVLYMMSCKDTVGVYRSLPPHITIIEGRLEFISHSFVNSLARCVWRCQRVERWISLMDVPRLRWLDLLENHSSCAAIT